MEQQAVQSAPENTGFAEKRSEHRRRVLKSGTILFNKGYASYACRVRNLTESGVMVEMGETTGIPHEFSFRMDGEKSMPASIVWRTKDKIGLMFNH